MHYTEELACYDRLLFLTLSVDPKVGLKPEDEEDELKRKVWQRYRKRLHARCRRAGEQFAYVYGVQSGDEGHRHLHVIMHPGTLSTSTLEDLWFECAGGIACHVQSIESEDHLRNAVAYALRDAFYREDNPWPGSHSRRIGASHGLGFNAEAMKEKRRAAAKKTPQASPSEDWRPPAPSSPSSAEAPGEGDEAPAAPQAAGEPVGAASAEAATNKRPTIPETRYAAWCREWLQGRLQTDVTLRSGPTGTLTGLTRTRAMVTLPNGSQVTCPPEDVVPSEKEAPLLTCWSGSSAGGMKTDRNLRPDLAARRVDLSQRTSTFTYVDANGRRVTRIHNPATGALVTRIVGPAAPSR